MILASPQDANGARQAPPVSLVKVPEALGVTVTSARPETAPTQPTIRNPILAQRLVAAAQRRFAKMQEAGK